MSQETDLAAIYEHREAYNRALLEGDVEAWLATLSDDCVYLPPGIPAVRGKEAIREWVTETLFEPYHNELDYDFEELEFEGARAIGWGRFHQTLTPRDGGEPLELRGNFLDVFHRRPDGAWTLARVAFSMDDD